MGTVSIAVRRAAPADVDEMVAVHDAAWRNAYRGVIPGRALEAMIARRGPDSWRRLVSRRGDMPAPALVLDFGGSVAGYATLGPARSRGLSARGEIYELYLAPEYQGIGLGRRLFSAACSDLARRGLAPVLVWVLADNQPARGFYERLGGRPIAVGDERLGGTRLSKIAYLFEVAAARR